MSDELRDRFRSGESDVGAVPVVQTAPASALGPLTPGQCHIWWSDAGAEATRRLTPVLDDVELDRMARYRRTADRRRFAVGCGLVRAGAAQYQGVTPRQIRVARRCRTCGGPHGRPQLERATGIELSVSHAGDRVVVAFTLGAPVGVDVEHAARDLAVDHLSRMALSDVERARIPLGMADRTRMFLEHWTRKEAVLKALGAGLRLPPAELVLSPDLAAIDAWPPAVTRPTELSLFGLPVGTGYVASLAVLARCEELVHIDWAV